jgi:hypothetical protein
VITPIGVTASVSLGHTPSAYMEMVSSILAEADVYDNERYGPMVSDAISDGGWNLRLNLGYTVDEGFEVGVGYLLLTTSTTVSTGAIDRAARQRLPWLGMADVPTSVTLHALSARVGWRFVLEEHLVIRAALGFSHTVGAEVGLAVPEEIRERPEDPAGDMERAIAGAMTQYGFSPEILLSAGYRF